MQPDQIHLTDISRILIGQAPWSFLVEVLIRAVITYLILWAAMRLMGKRVAGQMSGIELTIVVTLGAAIGVPLQAPDRGLVPAIVILLVAIAYQRGLNLLAFRQRKAETILQGDVVSLVADGRLSLIAMKHMVLSHERLFSVLRQEGLVHLGQVKRVYSEADGRFSVYRTTDPKPGLCLVPQCDLGPAEEQFGVDGHYACRNCGETLQRQRRPDEPCPHCSACNWTNAVQKDDLTELRAVNPANQHTSHNAVHSSRDGR